MNLASLPTLYSVFNYQSGLYDYYQPSSAPTLPASGTLRPARGKTPESLAVLLPEDTVLVGQGPTARGVIASEPSFVGALGELPDSVHHIPGWVSMFAALGSLYLTHRLVSKKRRK